MNTEAFIQMRKEFLEEMAAMDFTKGKEYANSENRFDNFNRIGAELGIPAEMVALVYFRKHVDAIFHFGKDLQKGYSLREIDALASEPIESRILDACNYLILLLGIIKDRRTALEADEKSANEASIEPSELVPILPHGPPGKSTVVDHDSLPKHSSDMNEQLLAEFHQNPRPDRVILHTPVLVQGFPPKHKPDLNAGAHWVNNSEAGNEEKGFLESPMKVGPGPEDTE